MKYSEFIHGNEGFQYSVNLQYDLENSKKIDGYIPTKKSVELIYKYLLNTRLKDSDKSTVLIGPYGKGKSHLLLILLNILSGINKESIEALIEKIRKVDVNCATLIEDIYGKERYLPVIINSNDSNLNQSFLVGIKKALDKLNVDNILPKTYFSAAIDTINKWRGYDVAYKRFKELVREHSGIDDVTYISTLKSYNLEAFEVFKIIFAEITSGVEFNPLINTDIVKLYEEVNHTLNDKYGYKGMIVVFDEFSKFIEASAKTNTAKDLKILQDFAELANRSDNPQMHLVCVTHKTVNEYISKIPQDKVDAWRAIEGRFNEIYFNSSAQQNYELISNAIIKDEEKFEEFWEQHKNDYGKYYDDAYSVYKAIFSEAEFNERIIRGCFPLSPYSTFVLPKISEKVAQNERTLFTFISKCDPHSVLDIIAKNMGDKELITLDNLYDYFEVLFKKEVFNEEIHDIWLKTDAALNHCDGDINRRIIKALAILYVVKDFKLLNPTYENVKKVLGVNGKDFEEAIIELKGKNVLMLRKSNNTLDFMPISNIDVDSQINTLIATKARNLDLSGKLEELASYKYILPRRYNDEYKMVRYFKRLYMTPQELLAYDSVKLLLETKKADGLVINILLEEEESIEKINTWVETQNDNRVILVLPKEKISLRGGVSRYVAINTLLNSEELLKEDPIVESQLNVLLEDTLEFIKYNATNIYTLENKNSKVKIGNEDVIYMDTIELSEICSKVCFNYYENAPKINNELINKNEISTPILKARNNILSLLMSDEYKSFESDGNSLDNTLFRTTVKNLGLVNSEDEYDKSLVYLFKEIKEFLLSSEEEERSFEELYSKIHGYNNSICARKGILPIYLAFIFKDYKNEIIIYLEGRKKKELAFTSEIINNINEEPSKYLIKLEKGTVEKDEYIEKLISTFENFKPRKASDSKYHDIVKSMQSWLQSLSKYSKSSLVDVKNKEELDKSIIKFRNSIMKFDINNREFLFKDLPKMMKAKSLDSCFNKIIKMKEALESKDIILREYLNKEVLGIFNKDYKGSLTSAISIWRSEIDSDSLNHLYDITTNSTLELFSNDLKDEIIVIEKLAYILTGLALEDWNDTTEVTFRSELKRVKETVEAYEVATDSDSNEGLIKIEVQSSTGESQQKTFDKVEITPTGNMLLSNLEDTFDEFGDSIEDSEKRSILMMLLEKYI